MCSLLTSNDARNLISPHSHVGELTLPHFLSMQSSPAEWILPWFDRQWPSTTVFETYAILNSFALNDPEPTLPHIHLSTMLAIFSIMLLFSSTRHCHKMNSAVNCSHYPTPLSGRGPNSNCLLFREFLFLAFSFYPYISWCHYKNENAISGCRAILYSILSKNLWIFLFAHSIVIRVLARVFVLCFPFCRSCASHRRPFR